MITQIHGGCSLQVFARRVASDRMIGIEVQRGASATAKTRFQRESAFDGPSSRGYLSQSNEHPFERGLAANDVGRYTQLAGGPTQPVFYSSSKTGGAGVLRHANLPP
jgi:hypothetical protein